MPAYTRNHYGKRAGNTPAADQKSNNVTRWQDCETKVGYASENDVKRKLNRYQNGFYHCDVCDQYHLTEREENPEEQAACQHDFNFGRRAGYRDTYEHTCTKCGLTEEFEKDYS